MLAATQLYFSVVLAGFREFSCIFVNLGALRRYTSAFVRVVEGTRGPMRVYIRSCGLLGLLWGLLERIVEGTRGPIRVYFRFSVI